MIRPWWGAAGNSGRELPYALKHKYHLPSPPPLLQFFFANIHTAKMSTAMLPFSPPPCPPALKLAGKWEGVGVWPVATPPPPVVSMLLTEEGGGRYRPLAIPPQTWLK